MADRDGVVLTDADLLDPTRDWPEGRVGGCLFAALRDVVPLDGQFGAFPLLNVPAALTGPLFGDGIHAYAVLDGAMIAGLEDVLAVADLRHDCLFRGVARVEWGPVAPWLVRLERDNTFVRALFTRTPGDLPWHYWMRGPGVYLGTAAPFDAVLAHLRRFTRLRDPQDQWFYFRFWERHVLPALAMAGDDGPAAALGEGLVAAIDGAAVQWLIPEPAADAVLSVQRAPDRTGRIAPPGLSVCALAALNRATADRQRRDDISIGLAALPETQAAGYRGDARLLELWALLLAQGFTQPEQRRAAIGLYLRAAERQDHARAWGLLTDAGPGPGNRLWHLRRSLEEQDA